MDTKNHTQAKIPAMRTYAKDLEINRKAKGLPPQGELSVPESREVSPKLTVKKNEVTKVPKAIHRVTENIVAATPLPPLNTIHNNKKPVSPKISSNDLKDDAFIVDNEDGAAATIITDTKRNRFKLIPAIIASVSSWFSAKKLSFNNKKAPKYTVPETTRRKGVIQKATGVTGKLATSDFSLIHERIRQRKENEDRPTPETTWSANTEPVFLLLENPEPAQITNVQVVAKKSFRNIPTETPAPRPVIVVPTPVTEILPPPTIETSDSDTLPSISPQPENKEVPPLPPETIAESYPVETIPSDAAIENTHLSKAPAYLRFLLLNTNSLTLGIFVGMMALMLIAFYGYTFLAEKTVSINDADETKALLILNTPLKLVSGKNNDRVSLLEVFETIKHEEDEAVQVAFIFSESNANIIPPHILLSLLDLNLEINLARSITHLRLGHTKNDAPFLLLKVSDETAVQGGLLASEDNLKQNLADIFSFSTETETAKFVDGSLSGIDVRLLKKVTGSDILIYGIIDNLIIVTKDSQAFTELKDLIK
jgi:hypothetical protein